jgi:hypothetical protein
MLGSFSEFERNVITERTLEGRKEKAKGSGHACGEVPYGSSNSGVPGVDQVIVLGGSGQFRFTQVKLFGQLLPAEAMADGRQISGTLA